MKQNRIRETATCRTGITRKGRSRVKTSHTELAWRTLSRGCGPARMDGFARGTKGRAVQGQGLTLARPAPGKVCGSSPPWQMEAWVGCRPNVGGRWCSEPAEGASPQLRHLQTSAGHHPFPAPLSHSEGEWGCFQGYISCRNGAADSSGHLQATVLTGEEDPETPVWLHGMSQLARECYRQRLESQSP